MGQHLAEHRNTIQRSLASITAARTLTFMAFTVGLSSGVSPRAWAEEAGAGKFTPPESSSYVNEHGYKHMSPRDSRYRNTPQTNQLFVPHFNKMVLSDRAVKRISEEYATSPIVSQNVAWEEVKAALNSSGLITTVFDERSAFLGWKFHWTTQHDPFDKLGLLSGDILLAVNGLAPKVKVLETDIAPFPGSFFSEKTAEIYVLRGEKFIRIRLITTRISETRTSVEPSPAP